MSRGSWDGSGLVGQDGIQVSGIWIFRGVFRARRVASRYYYQNGKKAYANFLGGGSGVIIILRRVITIVILVDIAIVIIALILAIIVIFVLRQSTSISLEVELLSGRLPALQVRPEFLLANGG